MRFTRTLLFVSAVGLIGCGGDSPTSSSQGSGPSRAQITVTAANPVLSYGSVRNFRVSFSLTTKETAGLGANMNYIRIEPRVFGSVVERQEIGSSDIVQQTGSNRVEANGTRNDTVFMEFNNPNANDILLTVGFTDDRGNKLEATFTITF